MSFLSCTLPSWAVFGKLTSMSAQFHQALARVHDVVIGAIFGNLREMKSRVRKLYQTTLPLVARMFILPLNPPILGDFECILPPILRGWGAKIDFFKKFTA